MTNALPFALALNLVATILCTFIGIKNYNDGRYKSLVVSVVLATANATFFVGGLIQFFKS